MSYFWLTILSLVLFAGNLYMGIHNHSWANGFLAGICAACFFYWYTAWKWGSTR